ncbi:hypothetical protein WJX73_005031 [Symbiochloris irregularis]|uniref:Protein kinase domain-containing protein n=1 Tax=Symbiochloris irregularis TaxID=706552 RepID=A0AAW1NJD7_9CHLO
MNLALAAAVPDTFEEDLDRFLVSQAGSRSSTVRGGPWAVPSRHPSLHHKSTAGGSVMWDTGRPTTAAGARTTGAWAPCGNEKPHKEKAQGVSQHKSRGSAITSSPAPRPSLPGGTPKPMSASWSPTFGSASARPSLQYSVPMSAGKVPGAGTLPAHAPCGHPALSQDWGDGLTGQTRKAWTACNEDPKRESTSPVSGPPGQPASAQEPADDDCVDNVLPSDPWGLAGCCGADLANAPSHSTMLLPGKLEPFAGLPTCMEEAEDESGDEPEDAQSGLSVIPQEPRCTWTLANFTLGDQLGSGAFGEVFVATEIQCGRTVALKRVRKQMLADHHLSHLAAREIEMHGRVSRLQHPNILELYGSFQDEGYYYMILQYIDGVDLLEFLQMYIEDTGHQLYEADAAEMVGAIADALRACHEADVVHRDVKMENVLVDSSGCLKLADFGSANVPALARKESICGTTHYQSPELVEKTGHDCAVDLWGLGVVLFVILAGEMPFGGSRKEGPQVIEGRITSGKRKALPQHVSREAQQLVDKLLSPSPGDRPSAQQVLSHPWIVNNTGPAQLQAPQQA